MTIDSKILGMTTIINASSLKYGYSSQGSGFYYSEVAKDATGPVNHDGLGWHKVEGTWLITNRHVAFPSVELADGTKKETVPDSFTFCMREVVANKIEWIPISLTGDELLKRTKVHKNKGVDVVAINVEDLQINLVKENQDKKIIAGIQLTNNNLPSESQPTVESTTDVIVCSYPYAFYDSFNKYPIIKSGIIASSWGSYFNGNPYFLVDAKLFPGSSGGLVISKPIDMAMINGKLMHSKEKQYIFLGIYSGEYSYKITQSDGTKKEDSYGLGIVWYSSLVPFIIKEGIQFA